MSRRRKPSLKLRRGAHPPAPEVGEVLYCEQRYRAHEVDPDAPYSRESLTHRMEATVVAVYSDGRIQCTLVDDGPKIMFGPDGNLYQLNEAGRVRLYRMSVDGEYVWRKAGEEQMYLIEVERSRRPGRMRWYGPNNSGYTGIIERAGRYTLKDARRSVGHSDHLRMVREQDAHGDNEDGWQA